MTRIDLTVTVTLAGSFKTGAKKPENVEHEIAEVAAELRRTVQEELDRWWVHGRFNVLDVSTSYSEGKSCKTTSR